MADRFLSLAGPVALMAFLTAFLLHSGPASGTLLFYSCVKIARNVIVVFEWTALNFKSHAASLARANMRPS
jgi:hypothetical protein